MANIETNVDRFRQMRSLLPDGGGAGMGQAIDDEGEAARGQSAEILEAGGPQVGAGTDAPPPVGGDPAGDKAAKEKQQDEKAKVDWQSILGEKLGGKLFELIKDKVDTTELTKYAEKGTEALAKQFGQLGDQVFKDDAGQAGALNGFLQALSPELKKLADEWIEGPTGQKILHAISDWVEEHPKTVLATLGVALIGAGVAAYLTNMDPPAFEKTFKLGKGFSAGGSIDIGPIQKLAIQAASLKVAYESETLNASLSAKVTRDDKGQNTTSVEGSVEKKLGQDTKLKGTGLLTLRPDGSADLKLEGGLDTKLAGKDLSLGGGLTETRGGQSPGRQVNGRFKLGDDNENIAADGKWDPGTKAFDLKLSQTTLGGKLTQSMSTGRDANGQGTQGMDLQYKPDEHQTLGLSSNTGPNGQTTSARYSNDNINGSGFGVNANAKGGAENGFGLGVTFTEEQFKAALDAEMSQGVMKLGGSAEYQGKNGLNAGLDFKADLTAGRFDHYGFHLGWKDPKQFRSFMLKYDAEWDAKHPGNKHAVELMGETMLGKVETRFSGKMNWDAGGNTSMDVGVMGAKQLNSDWRVLGGAGYRGGETEGQYKGGMYVQAGVQYKKVPLVLTYDPGQKSVMLGVTIPFGR